MNQKKLYETDGLKWPVEVKETRTMFGRSEALIMPIGGAGSKWVTVGHLSDPPAEDEKGGAQ
jgi:hypothetical protein